MEMLGKYGLLDKLGEDILGPVYKAYDSSSHRNVMLITLGMDIPWDPTLKERFIAECAAILRLRHPNLAAVYEQGEDRKISFLAAELLPGKNLAQLIAEKAGRTLEWKISFMVQATAGLAHAHAQGVLHRCLRPACMHMLPDGVVKISGFGCGSIANSANAGRRTTVANVYLSPEQLMGREATAQSDIFSLGLIFYEFVTGVHPFHDADSNTTLDHILHQPQFPTVEQFPDLPFNVWPILERCLAKETEERYPSMRDLGSACQGMLEELAEDSECMRIELQTALPRLRKVTKRCAAPASLNRLQKEIEQVLFRVHDSDYQSLNRLILTWTEQHHLLESTAEASSPGLPVSPVIPPEQAPPAESKDDASIAASPGPQGSAEAAPRTPATNGFLTPEGVSEPSPAACPENAPHAPAVTPDEVAAAKEIDLPAVTPAESRPSPVPEITAESTPASAAAKVDPSLSRPSPGPKDSFTELLRKIDQGQESTQKLVDSFLAGRQKMASGKRKPQSMAEDKSASERPDSSSSAPGPEASPPAPTAIKADAQPPEPPGGMHAAGVQESPVENPLAEPAPPPAAPPKRAGHRTALWISAAAVLLSLTFAIPAVRDRLLTDAGKGLMQKGWRAIAGGSSVQTPTVDPMAIAVQNQLNFARRNILLEEAEVLHAVGRGQEARTFLGRLLELYPDYSPAKEELDRITAEISAATELEDQPSPAQKLLNSAALSIRAGNLQKAKIDLDAAEQLEPGLPETAKLRKSLEAKKTELVQSAARDQEAQLRAKESEASALRAEELYRQGKYDDALAAIDAHEARYPASTQIQDLRSRAVEVKQNLKSYEAALSAGKSAEAQAAVEKIEMINPADPGLAAMRKRAESAPAPGSASLSVYPIAEPAVLILDDRPVGAGGELVNHTVSAGRHKLAARIANGQLVEMAHDFANGQAITLVYDVPGQVLRTMVEPDRARVARSKARMQTHRFAVEHPHGVLRGSCKGDLIIDYNHVMFQPTTGAHGFSVSFKDLRLRIENKNAVLFMAGDSTEFFTFKLPGALSAETLRKVWDDLAAPIR